MCSISYSWVPSRSQWWASRSGHVNLFNPLDRGLGTPHVRSEVFGEENLFVQQDFRWCFSVSSDRAWVRISERPATGLAAALRHTCTIHTDTTCNVPRPCWKVKVCFLAGITARVGRSLSWLTTRVLFPTEAGRQDPSSSPPPTQFLPRLIPRNFSCQSVKLTKLLSATDENSCYLHSEDAFS